MTHRPTAELGASATVGSRSATHAARMFLGVWSAEGNPLLQQVRPPTEIDGFEIASPHARIKAWGSIKANGHPSRLVAVDADWTSLVRGRAFPLSRVSLEGTSDEDLFSRAGKFFSKLDGRFCVCLLEPQGKCILATDMLGAGGVFYTHIGSSLFFSSHLGLLLQALGPVEEDPLGLAGLVISSGSMSGLTPFKGIHRLQSSEMLLASPERGDESRIRVRKYAEPADLLELGNRPSREDFRSLSDGFSALLQESIVRESLEGTVSLFLSGGLDSRALGIALRSSSHDAEVVSVTYGTKRSRDRRVARTIAPSLGFPNRLVPYSRWDFSTYSNVIVDLNGGMSGLNGSHNMVGFEYAGKLADVGLLGFLGGPISGSHFGNGKTLGFELAKSVMFPRLRPLSALAILSSEIAEHVSTLERLHSDLGDLEPHHRHLLLDLTIRQATCLSSTLDLADPYLEPSCPLYYRPLISYLANMPYSWLEGRRFYRRWVQESMEVIRSQNGFDLSRIRQYAPAVLFLWLNRGLNTVLTPHAILDWNQRFKQSRPWIERTLRTCDESLAKSICVASLNRKPDRHHLALFVIPACLAKSAWSA